MKPELATPEIRLKNLLDYFGWQGGTIHQITAETGVDSLVLLHGIPTGQHDISSPYHLGGSALATCSKAWRVDVLAPKHRYDANYWIGVACGHGVCQG